MILYSRRKWVAAIYLLVVSSVNPQMAMFPMFPPPPVQIAVPMPVPVPIMIRDAETTTTTTTERNHNGVAFPVAVPMPMPMPVPMPVPFAFPAFPAAACQSKTRPKNCPPCPPCLCMPSCTPAFFSYCSPCHQKCRCRSEEDTPTPIPPRRPPPPAMGPAYGVAVPVPQMFAPPPVVVVPFPPPRPQWRPRPQSSSYSFSSDSTDYTDDCSSSSSYEQRRKRRKKIGHIKRRPIYRRQFESIEMNDNELVKPILTYVSQDGNVKLKRKLTNDEAAELMNDKPYQKIRVMAGVDNENMPRVLITSRNEKESARAGKYPNNHRRRQVVLTTGTAQHILGQGKKELVFRPPGGKKISNLSVSFQISE